MKCHIILTFAIFTIFVCTGCGRLVVQPLKTQFNAVRQTIKEKNDAMAAQNKAEAEARAAQAKAIAEAEDAKVAQAEADKICSSHINISTAISSGIVYKCENLQKYCDYGFIFAEKMKESNGQIWTFVYAFPNEDAKFGVLVKAITEWDRKDMDTALLIEKCKNTYQNATVKHFYDSGDVDIDAKPPMFNLDKRNHLTENVERKTKVLQGNSVIVKEDFDEKGNKIQVKNPDFFGKNRAFGLKPLELKGKPKIKASERKIGFVLANEMFQIIINEASQYTDYGLYTTACPVTGLYEKVTLKTEIKGTVQFVFEDLAQIEAYRKLYDEQLAKLKEENNNKIKATQEKNLQF